MEFFITILVIYGVHAATREGMILDVGRLQVLCYDHFKTSFVDKLFKVLFNCTPCMASLYGSVSFVSCFSFYQIGYLPIWVFSMCGFNFILNKFLNK